jgi:hypothetical protein
LYPTKPENFFEQIHATGTAILREISYPQAIIHNRWFAFLSPPPLGRILFLACYWAVILFLSSHNVVIHDAYYWERIGFRNAWISVTQVPLIFFLATKSSFIGLVIGVSHERLNWLHRWVSRTLLVTVSIHGGFFMREWVRADFVELELEMMPMVKYGIGAWSILVWTFITSISPLRRMSHRLFVLQHIAAAAVLLWCLWVHVPSYAAYNVWLAIGTLALDWIIRLFLILYRNFRFKVGSCCNTNKRIGHQVELRAVKGDITIVAIKDVHFSWKAGQHLYLWIPRFGPLSHPFTIATPCRTTKECHCNEIQIAIKAQSSSGFSGRIHRLALQTQGTSGNSLTGLIAGPFGVPPKWEAYETLILICASTGASYCLPILESIVESSLRICTKRIKLLLVARESCHIEFYVDRLSHQIDFARKRGVILDVQISITGAEGLSDDGSTLVSKEVEWPSQEKDQTYVLAKSYSSSSSSSSTSSRRTLSPEKDCRCAGAGEVTSKEGRMLYAEEEIKYCHGRPNIANYIREPIEATGGETAVAVCGGKSLVASVRNSVASLSNERAVHKGTGAQGIFLHVEEYCF